MSSTLSKSPSRPLRASSTDYWAAPTTEERAAVIKTDEPKKRDWYLPPLSTRSFTDKIIFLPSAGELLTASDSQDEIKQTSLRANAPSLEPKAVEQDRPVSSDVLAIRPPKCSRKLLQAWECVISKVQADCVECELHDLTDESNEAEFAEVFISEFSLYDRDLLEEGAVFYWSIGYETSGTGTVKKFSEMRVRRMPPLSQRKRREILLRAQKLSDILNPEKK